MTIETKRRVFGIVMAAGSGRRFGSTKQLAEIAGVPLIRRATDCAAEVFGSRSVLVVGHDWTAVFGACGEWPGFLLYNTAYAAGLGTSVSLAVQSIRHVASAVVVMLADQPLVTTAHVTSLLDRWSGDSRELLATEFRARRGAPALLPSGCFDRLSALDGDAGARHLFDDPNYRLRTIEFEDAAVDIDTAEDLLRLSRSARS